MGSELAPFAAKMRAAGLPEVVIESFGRYYAQLRAGAQGKISRAEIDPVADVPDLSSLAHYRDAGATALARTAVIKLNGGLGTSMGMTQAKSLLPVKQGLTFLDIIAQQTLHLRHVFGCRLPLVLMNSFRTRADSQQVLARYPELATGLPLDFLQHQVPRIMKVDSTPAAWPRTPEHEWCPPGHGDIYLALATSGMLQALLEAGFEYVFVSNADNLGAVLELEILGWFAAERLPFLMEVTDRTEADRKGGHLARYKDGRLMLREVAQCPDDDLGSFQDIRLYRYFNTNNLWVDLHALASVMDAGGGLLSLPMIINEKAIDPTDPRSARVIQLETAMGAAISIFDGARALRVPRARFVPVKTTSDLLVLWSDAYELGSDYRVALSARRQRGPLFVDLDPAVYRTVRDLEQRIPAGAPSLLECDRLLVRGDVHFEADVTIEGSVEVRQEGNTPRIIAAGTRLRG